MEDFCFPSRNRKGGMREELGSRSREKESGVTWL